MPVFMECLFLHTSLKYNVFICRTISQTRENFQCGLERLMTLKNNERKSRKALVQLFLALELRLEDNPHSVRISSKYTFERNENSSLFYLPIVKNVRFFYYLYNIHSFIQRNSRLAFSRAKN